MGGARRSWIGLGLALSACTTFSDLGGTSSTVNPTGKGAGAECTVDDDCQSGSCAAGVCTRPAGTGSATDGITNGDETDIDCGGANAPKCADTKACTAPSDCANGVCKSGACASPAPDDGIKNGDETDVDCGGTKAPKCAAGKGCATNDDCATDGCTYAKKCVEEHAKSCTGHFGGDTCGAGETGAADAKHESCCATAASTTGVKVGKYHVTAGRMRAFTERLNGNVRAWAETNPPGWNRSFTAQLPTTMAEVDGSFGPGNKRGCSVGPTGKGGRTWWQTNVPQSEQSDFAKDVLDEKALNCFPWYMALAICVFDGGRLPTHAENLANITNGGRTTWPWQPADNAGYNPNAQDDRVIHQYSYATPNPGAIRMDGGGPLDRAFWMAPPGRRPGGNNQAGVADAVGNLLTWTSTFNQFSWTMSWEAHNRSSGDRVSTWSAAGPSTGEQDGYYAIGARCVFDP